MSEIRPPRLDRSPVAVPPLSLGTAPLGNLYAQVPDRVAHETGGFSRAQAGEESD